MIRSVAMILLFWVLAVLLVVALPQALAFSSPIATAGVKLAAILAVSYGLTRTSRRPASLDQALLVGALWLLLDIFVEVAVATHTGRSWFALIGSPAAPALRTCLLIGWIGAPALFVRRQAEPSTS